MRGWEKAGMMCVCVCVCMCRWYLKRWWDRESRMGWEENSALKIAPRNFFSKEKKKEKILDFLPIDEMRWCNDEGSINWLIDGLDLRIDTCIHLSRVRKFLGLTAPRLDSDSVESPPGTPWWCPPPPWWWWDFNMGLNGRSSSLSESIGISSSHELIDSLSLWSANDLLFASDLMPEWECELPVPASASTLNRWSDEFLLFDDDLKLLWLLWWWLLLWWWAARVKPTTGPNGLPGRWMRSVDVGLIPKSPGRPPPPRPPKPGKAPPPPGCMWSDFCCSICWCNLYKW